MEKITILIADDHTLVRETWSFILNTDERFNVVAESGSGEDAVEQAKLLRPNVVIMDINLPGINGIEATQLIRKFSPGSKILGVSLHTQPTYARKMIQKGASGYVTKNSSREEMFQSHHGNPGGKEIHLRRNKKHPFRTGNQRRRAKRRPKFAVAA
jgi:two-component system invasion response regulator UvrY